MSSTAQEVTVTRVFDAPRDLVWEAWTKPEHFQHWFGTPPYTTPVDRISMDVRPGGAWKATMVSGDDGSELPFKGTYAEVDEPNRIVMVFEDAENPENTLTEVLTVTFNDLGDDRTEIVAHQAGHMPPEQYVLLEQGYGTFFDRLAAHLKTLR
jgi:uncharacterized protein YndB with AHSA1/START domain